MSAIDVLVALTMDGFCRGGWFKANGDVKGKEVNSRATDPPAADVARSD
jgi:hypothetical protein